jgi:hypothetical protein
VSHFVNGAAVKNIAEQTMAVRRHGNQIAMFIVSSFQNTGRGISEREMRCDAQAAVPQSLGRSFEIRAVVFHFLRISQLQLIVIARGESIGHVHQKQLRAEQPGQSGNMRQKRFVRTAVFESHENALIHCNLGLRSGTGQTDKTVERS